MGAHHHQPGQGGAGGGSAPQARQASGIQRLGGQGRQGGRKPRRALGQEAAGAAAGGRLAVAGGAGQIPQGCGQGGQVFRPFGVHRHQHLVREGRQPLPQPCGIALQVRQSQKLHAGRAQAAAAALLHPVGQVAGGVAEQAVAGEVALMHRLAVEPVHPVHGGAAALQEGGNEQGGVEGTQGRRQLLHLQGEVAAQGGIPPAHQQPVIEKAALPGPYQGLVQLRRQLPHPRAGLGGAEGPGVGQQEQQGRRMGQTGIQGGRVPAQEQGAAMHRLGAGGVIVDHDDLQGQEARCTPHAVPPCGGR